MSELIEKIYETIDNIYVRINREDIWDYWQYIKHEIKEMREYTCENDTFGEYANVSIGDVRIHCIKYGDDPEEQIWH